MNFIQGTLQTMEVGKGSVIIRIIPLIITIGAIIVLSDFGSLNLPFVSIGGVYKGLADPQSMDDAQLARQIARGKGFTTEFLRPRAVSQLHDFAVAQGLSSGKSGDLFPSDQFPPGTPRILPDTYNAPGFPYVLAGWFLLVHPEFDQPPPPLAAPACTLRTAVFPSLTRFFSCLPPRLFSSWACVSSTSGSPGWRSLLSCLPNWFGITP